jgi:hypothetical protein
MKAMMSIAKRGDDDDDEDEEEEDNLPIILFIYYYYIFFLKNFSSILSQKTLEKTNLYFFLYRCIFSFLYIIYLFVIHKVTVKKHPLAA